MNRREYIVNDALALLDGLIYLDKKFVVTTPQVRLHPSETHMLMCGLAGMSFTEIAERFGVSKAAVSRAFARLADKNVVRITKDASRNNRASVVLTSVGAEAFEQARQLRSRLTAALVTRLGSYDPLELETIERFVHDLDDYVRESFHSIPNGG